MTTDKPGSSGAAMTQAEWDAASPEKRVLYQFLAAMSEVSTHSGKRMREAILELVADLPEDLRTIAAPSQATQVSAPAPVLLWCEMCGEGTVAGLCRAKAGKCANAARAPSTAQPAQAGDALAVLRELVEAEEAAADAMEVVQPANGTTAALDRADAARKRAREYLAAIDAARALAATPEVPK